ncbi:VF530 family DNA-binding protein [Colwelliaceae bacterium BS250]
MDKQPYNPLHGVTLANVLTSLEAHFGFEELGKMIKIKCFTQDPSIKSSLKFLRKTPWAREKVEQLYIKYKHQITSNDDAD